MPARKRFHSLLPILLVALAFVASLLAVVQLAYAQSGVSQCASGGAVADAVNNLGLIADCEALLASRDALSGSATLNWSESTRISHWEGVTVAGSPTRVTGLDLRNQGLTGNIPAELRQLPNLQLLRLSGNELTECIPGELRDVADNDLDELGLPFCDVLLSGLTLDQGSLIPAFDPHHTNYSVVVGPTRVTILPTTHQDASVLFLDEDDVAVSDADDALPGHQVDFSTDLPLVKIRVVSDDGQANHTYRIADLGIRYDANENGVTERNEVISAIQDYFNHVITRTETVGIIGLYLSDQARVDETPSPPGTNPDLTVETPSVNDASPAAGETFTLSATVSNTGDGESAATTLRYYLSADANITASDTEVGTDAVGALAAAEYERGVDFTHCPIHGRDVLLRRMRGFGYGRIGHDGQLLGGGGGHGAGDATADTGQSGPCGFGIGERCGPGD